MTVAGLWLAVAVLDTTVVLAMILAVLDMTVTVLGLAVMVLL
jgi:hypothetical protein